ncbi:MAG: type II toxin-antitoxin system HicB family antitoxin [Bryobacteraceae bacterium]
MDGDGGGGVQGDVVAGTGGEIGSTFVEPPTATIEGVKRKISGNLSYTVFYEEDPEGGYVAFVPALPGCHTQGESLEEAESNAREAIALYVESLAAHGEPVPQEGRSFQGRVTIPFSVPA